MSGETADLVAIDPESTHGKFELASSEQCWIALGLVFRLDPLEACDVPIEDPPPQEPPKPEGPGPAACRKELGKEACEASGGTFMGGTSGERYCDCP